MIRAAVLVTFLWLCAPAAPAYAQAPAGPPPGYREPLPADWGREIARISFFTPLNLEYEDLLASIALRRGQHLTEEAAAASIDRLLTRKVFQAVELLVKEDAGLLEVLFHMPPLPFPSELVFGGNEKLSERQLVRLAAFPFDAPISDRTLRAAEERIRTGYAERGYRAAAVRAQAEPLERTAYLSRVRFAIKEGYRSKIGRIALTGKLPEGGASFSDEVRHRWSGKIASRANIKRMRKTILAALRRRGYLQASVDVPQEEFQELSGDVDLAFAINVREPLKIVFEGNRVLSGEELLAPLRLEERTIPFGAGAVRTLRREVRKLYQEHGLYYTRVRSSQRDDTRGGKIVVIRIEESPVFRLRRIEFKGNEAFSARELRSIISTRPAAPWLFSRWRPGFLVREGIKNDAAALKEWYESQGYFGTKVDFAVEQSGRNRLVLRFLIDEPPRSVVQSVEVIWRESGQESRTSSLHSVQRLHNLAPRVKTGDPFRLETLQQEREELRAAVMQTGYPNASVDMHADPVSGRVDYLIEPGVQVRIGKVVVQGNAYTHDDVILKELNLRSGGLWDTKAIEQSQEALLALRFFRTAAIGPLDGAIDTPVEDIAVAVQEQDTASVTLTTGFNTEDGFRVGTDVAQRNLGGGGAAVIAGFDAYVRSGDRVFDAVNSRIAYSRPHFLDTPLEAALEGFAQSSLQLVEEYSYDRIGASAVLRYRLAEHLKGSSGYTAYNERLYDVEDDLIIGPNDFGSTVYSFIHTELDFDRRDNPFNPHRGHRSYAEFRLADEALGSQAELAGMLFQETVYLPFGARWTWANNARFRLAEPLGRTQVVPLGQRLFLGGRNSLRGFSRNVIGPRGEELSIVGGDASINVNSEVHYGFSESIEGLLFIDAGQAILRNKGVFSGDSLEFSDMRFSPGFGIHYLTPIGPISAEAGFALDREFGERWGRIYIGIGNAF